MTGSMPEGATNYTQDQMDQIQKNITVLEHDRAETNSELNATANDLYCFAETVILKEAAIGAEYGKEPAGRHEPALPPE